MSKKGWKTLNIRKQQADRIDAVVQQGLAPSRDEFVRTWTEVGLVLTRLAAAASTVRNATEATAKDEGTEPPRRRLP